MKTLLLFASLMSAGAAWAETIAVDGASNVGCAVEAGCATLQGRVAFGVGGPFIKTGAGTLVLPLGALDKTRDYEIRVSDGTLALRQGGEGAAPAAAPAAVREQAAFWADASDASGSLVMDGDVVTRWCDRRETDFAAPTRWNARPASTGLGTVRTPQTRVVKDGRAAVYFGGLDTENDCFMKFSDGAAEKKLSNVRHLFAVHGVYGCWGAPIGATGNPCDWFAGAAIKAYAPDMAAHFIQYANTMSGLFTGRTFLDGARIDPLAVPPKRGFQLLETEFTDVPTVVDAFYNMKNAKGRQGGDYLAEVIVFTNALTASERLAVEDYLMRKWDLGGARAQSGRGRVATALGTTVSAAADTPETTDFLSLAFTGEGAFEKTGEGTLVVGRGQFRDFRGTFDLADGAVRVCAGRLPAVKIAAGERLLSTEEMPGTVNGAFTKEDFTNRLWYARCGQRIVKTAAAPNRFEKAGDGTLTVQAIPSSVACVDVQGGTFTLAAPPTSSARVAGAPLAAAIPNADFEAPCQANTTYNRCRFTQGEMCNGWTCASGGIAGYLCEDGSPGDNGAVTPRGRATMSYMPIAQGVQALIVCNDGEAYTDRAVFPKSGRYVLSLLESSRYSTIRTGSYRVKIGATWQTATTRAVRLVNAQGFRRVSVDLGHVEAGTWCFGFAAFAGNARGHVDGALIFDDLRVDYVGEADDEEAVRIPNGDFECCTNRTLALDGVSVNPVLAYARTADNEATGWTFQNDDPAHPAVALVTTMTPPGRGADALQQDNYRPSDVVDGLLGSVHLSLFGAAGSASTTFRLARGRYYLRGKLLHRGGKFDNAFANAGSGSSTVSATVSVAGRETPLGAVTARSSVMQAHEWPNAFEMAEEGEVTLTVRQTEARGMCLLDDLALAKTPLACAEGREIVANGSFEAGLENWTEVRATFSEWGVSAVNPQTANPAHNVPFQFGPLPYAGDVYLYVNDDAGVYQTLALAPGLYRLAFAAHTRNTPGYDRQPIRAWLGDADGRPVVEIGRTPLLTSLFDQEFVWEFRVAEAGVYRLYLQGTDTFKGAPNRHTSVLDGVSLTRLRETDAQPSVTAATQLRLAEGTRLRLDFDGAVKVESVTYNGVRHRGVLSAGTHPEFIDGRGQLKTAPPRALVIVLR